MFFGWKDTHFIHLEDPGKNICRDSVDVKYTELSKRNSVRSYANDDLLRMKNPENHWWFDHMFGPYPPSYMGRVGIEKPTVYVKTGANFPPDLEIQKKKTTSVLVWCNPCLKWSPPADTPWKKNRSPLKIGRALNVCTHIKHTWLTWQWYQRDVIWDTRQCFVLQQSTWTCQLKSRNELDDCLNSTGFLTGFLNHQQYLWKFVVKVTSSSHQTSAPLPAACFLECPLCFAAWWRFFTNQLMILPILVQWLLVFCETQFKHVVSLLFCRKQTGL